MKKTRVKNKDPHAKREAEKYSQPIASREFILDKLEAAGKPLSHEDLVDELGLTDEDDIEALRRRLIAMERDGQVIRDRRKAYGRVDKMNLIRGRVQGHKDGFGFVIPQAGGEDLYLPFRQMQKVFDGDEVLVRPSGANFKGKNEAVIVEVLSRNTEKLVGRYYKEQGVEFVRPDNPRINVDILVVKDEGEKAKSGQFVELEIVQQPDRKHPPAGKILQVLGDHMAPGMEIDVAIRSHNIPHVWPQVVLDQAGQIPEEVQEKDKEHRVDLRHLPFVTIDGEDARDFDDAVYCEAITSAKTLAEKNTSGWRLWVAIADVSSYVEPDTALDREAVLRATSVYFPDHVIPMLPEAISNGLCSLNPHVDRLTMVCEMTISAEGKVSDYKFFEAVIHSHARLTYNQVGKMIAERNQEESDSNLRKQYREVVPHIDELHNLYKVLRKERSKRGAIDFETVETRIIFDEQRKIEKIVPVQRNDAHKLIEECMLCANVSAANFLQAHDLVGLYRVHEGPTEEKLENLREFFAELGLYLPGGNKPSPAHYQEVLKKIQGRPDAHVIQTVMLRSLKQAVYQPENLGHFGLHYEAYAHFTSPIRRYPDLLVHRAIRHIIHSRKKSAHVQRVRGAALIEKKAIFPYGMGEMLQLGEQCSLSERRADDATRDVTSWLKCEFLQDHVGDKFEGVVTSVTGFGLFVELKDLYVEGLVHITSLPRDYYHFEAAQYRLIGERSRRVFRLGDELLVQVVRVNLDERKVDFELVESKKTKTNLLTQKEVDKATSGSTKNKKSPRGDRPKKTSAKSGSGKKRTSSKSKAGKKSTAKTKAKTKAKKGRR
ncbi:ribonuclease R [Aurantivibrio infirmus]